MKKIVAALALVAGVGASIVGGTATASASPSLSNSWTIQVNGADGGNLVQISPPTATEMTIVHAYHNVVFDNWANSGQRATIVIEQLNFQGYCVQREAFYNSVAGKVYDGNHYDVLYEALRPLGC